MKYGLSKQTVDSILNVLSKYPQVERAILFGSRARDNYRDNSDIDLTLLGQNIDLTTLNKIETEIDDLLLPWKFDLSIYHHIENPALIKVIDREGITFYP